FICFSANQEPADAPLLSFADFGCCGGFGRCDVPWLGPDPASAAHQTTISNSRQRLLHVGQMSRFAPPPSPPRPAPPPMAHPTAAAPSLESDSSRRTRRVSPRCSPKRVAVCCCRLFKVTPLKSTSTPSLARSAMPWPRLEPATACRTPPSCTPERQRALGGRRLHRSGQAVRRRETPAGRTAVRILS
uniref:Os01g0778700 protein n=1 Tax=Macrostomum lignano TaxID=282301 RepID=A0A1I8FN18_9PLAT